MNLETICESTMQAVRQTSEYVRGEFDRRTGDQIEEKGLHNYVTHVDKASEEQLVNSLGEILPEAGFIAEEGTNNTRKERFNWVIDPIDGTTNFIHRTFPFAISIGLMEYDEPVLGVIYEFGFNEMFHGWKGGGAFLNGKPIQTSKESTLSGSLIATGFPYTNYDRMDRFMQTIDWFMKNSAGLRRLGSAATDIAWVACGRYDGFYEYGLKPWDVAAGVAILKEAGGKSTNFEGSQECIFEEEIICSNGHTHNEFVTTISQIMQAEK